MSRHGRPRCPDPPPPGGLHEAVFRMLLLAYPGAFRRSYGWSMIQLFRRGLWRARVEAHSGAVGLFWLRVLKDVLTSALGERSGTSASLRSWGGAEPAGPAGNREREETRRGGMKLEALFNDIRHAVRALVKAPGFSLAAVVILALGIGANVAMFSLVNAVLLEPQPFEEPERLVDIYQDSDDGEPSSTSYPAYRDMRDYDVFSGVAAYSPGRGGIAWARESGDIPASVEWVSASYMPTLGLRPALGRWFTEAEDQVGAGEVTVVSYQTWESKMGADPGVLGRVVRLNARPVTIVGVGPRGYDGSVPGFRTDFWLSISTTPVGGNFRVANLQRRQDHWYQVKARLAEGVTVAQAQAAMDRLAARLAEEFPALNRGRGITVFGPGEVRMHPSQDAQLLPTALGLMGVVGLVLLVACANLANLLLVRGSTRTREMGVRLAMGGSRLRIAQLFLLESLTLAFAGGAVGVWVAWAAIRGFPLVADALPLPGEVALAIDGSVLLFTSGVSVLTGLLFGILPAVQASRSEVADILREEGPRTAGGRKMGALRSLLVAAQVAVSVILLMGAGLFVRSLVAATRVDPGFQAERLAYVRVNPFQAGLSGPEGQLALEELRRELDALPGVEGVSAAFALPASGRGSTTTIVEGYDPPTGTGSVELSFNIVDEHYFEAVGQAVVVGRSFTADDGPQSPRVVMVNETLARRFWGTTDVVGRRVAPQSAPDSWRTVIGVVEDAPVQSLTENPTPLLIYPSRQSGALLTNFLVRTSGDPSSLLGPVRAAVAGMSVDLPLVGLATVDEYLGSTLSDARLGAGLLTAVAALALLLAAVGIYSVISYTVTLRATEIGIRMALGASAFQVVRTVVGQVMVVVMLGGLVGLALGVMGAGQLEGLLFQTVAWDPVTLAAVAGALGLAALMATVRPARSAAAANPASTLRAE